MEECYIKAVGLSLFHSALRYQHTQPNCFYVAQSLEELILTERLYSHTINAGKSVMVLLKEQCRTWQIV
jgi:hypothetical protein